MNYRPLFAAGIICLSVISVSIAEGDHNNHPPPMQVDPQLSQSQVIQTALSRYPQSMLVHAMSEEAEALQKRANTWLSGSPSISFRYQTDQVADNTGLREIEQELELPLWRWGQHHRGKILAEQASNQVRTYAHSLHWQVAGKVRESLWAIRLQYNRYHFSQQAVTLAERLKNTIKRRVELGDLAKANLLLIESDRLEKIQALMESETKVLYSHHRYLTLTGLQRLPEQWIEARSQRKTIDEHHPALSLINAQIQRKRAELQWQVAAGGGQPSLLLGGKSERDRRGERNIESFSVALSVPFGGRAHIEPELAQTRVQLTEAMAKQALLLRQLRMQLHEADQALDLDQNWLDNAQQRQTLARKHLEISHKAFAAGELSLIDLLKIQARAQDAERNVRERLLIIQRDTARYNQVAGELP